MKNDARMRKYDLKRQLEEVRTRLHSLQTEESMLIEKLRLVEVEIAAETQRNLDELTDAEKNAIRQVCKAKRPAEKAVAIADAHGITLNDAMMIGRGK